MKRLGCQVIVFAAIVFMSVGCRRGSPTPREPVAVVNEADFITTPSTKDFADEFKKKAKEAPVPEGETEADRKARIDNAEREAKQKEDDLAQKKKNDLILLGKTYREFAKLNPVSKHTKEHFQQYLRRSGLEVLRSDVETKKFEIVTAVDLSAADQIIAFKTESEQGVHLVVLASLAIEVVKQEEIKQRIKKQELRFAWQKIDAFKRQNPGVQPSLAQFVSYLRDNASPVMVAMIENKTFLVNLGANPANPGHPIVCQAMGEPEYRSGEAPVTKHLVVMGTGLVQSVTPGFVSENFKNQ